MDIIGRERRRSAATLGVAFATGGNNFDLMRLAGALLVLASHAWVLTGHAEEEPFAPALARYTDGGGLAVAMFFVLSGFLIAGSAERTSVPQFIRARILRLYPALAAALVVQTCAIGLIATRLPAATYLHDPATWAALAKGLAFSPPLGLPGVFEDNPVPLAVNGSLWTLRIEALCYAGLLAAAVLRLLRPGWTMLGLAAGFAAVAATMAARVGLLPPVLATLKIVSILDCLTHFLAGAALWVWRDRLPHRAGLAFAGLAALVVGAGSLAAPLLWHAVLPYLVLHLGLTRPVAQGLLRRTGDLSYGIYLYAFPVEQSLVAWLGPGIGPLELIGASLPPVILCAGLSRRLVELPALRLRHRTRMPAL